MTKRTRIKKTLIILVIAIFLMVTFGTFVMYLVGKGQENKQPVHNEVQPTINNDTGDNTAITGTVMTTGENK